MSKKFAAFIGSALFSLLPLVAAPQQQQSPQSQPAQDVPEQKPGTNSPDMGKQRQPSSKSSTTSTAHPGDIPNQKPTTDNPDVAKQRHSTGKKHKSTHSTSGTT